MKSTTSPVPKVAVPEAAHDNYQRVPRWVPLNKHNRQSAVPDVEPEAGGTIWRERLSLILLGLCAIALLFWRLGSGSLNDWDEAIYAQVAKEIVASGDWLTLHWGYAVWFHKPPLFMWMTATFFQLFGVSEFWARVPSAISGVGLVGCTYLIARKLCSFQGAKQDGHSLDSRTGHVVGLLSATVLLTNYTFIHFSRFGTTDITLTFFSYLAIYAYLHVHQGRSWAWCGVWSAISLAMMTKGVAGLPVAIALFFTLMFTGRLWRALCTRTFWLGIGLASLILVPWHWAMIALHGQAFIDQYFLYHVVERSTGGGLEGNDGGLFFYFKALGNHFFPWVYLLPLALVQQAKRLQRPHGSLWLILLLFVAVVFGGYSLAGTKLSWYIIPIYPALAIWVGTLLHRALMCRDRLACAGLLVSGTIVMVLFPTEIVFLSSSLQQMMVIAGLVTLVLLSVAVYELGWRRQVLSVALCGLFLVAGVREIKGVYHAFQRPVATLSQAAEVSVDAPVPAKKLPLLVARLSERLYTPTAMFYSNRPIAWVRSAGDLAAATDTSRKQDILLAAADLDALTTDYDIDVYAKEGKLIYAGIQKRDNNPSVAPSAVEVTP